MDKKVLVFALILLALLPAVALASTDITTAQEQNQDSFSKIDNNTEGKPATDSLWKPTPTVIIAVAAVLAIALSTGFSLYAISAARKAAQGELIVQISNTYGSQKMLEAMMRLVWWVEKEEEKSEEENWLKTFGELRKNSDRYCEIAQVDKDRRKFLNYYEAIDIIKKHRLLSKKIVKSLHLENQELFYKMIVGPLTKQIETRVTKEWPRLTVNYQGRNSNP